MLEPKVAIILINWNGLKDTLECLESLTKVAYKNKEIIVVDNGSKNEEAEKIKRKYKIVHLIKLPQNTGFTGGCNAGIEKALKDNTQYILLLNNDTVVTKDFLKPLVDFSEKNKKVGMVSSLILYYKKRTIWFAGGRTSYITGFSRHIGKEQLITEVKNREATKVEYVTGCCLLIKRKVIEKIGLLDPVYFSYYEDKDWSFRAMKKGYDNYLIPSSIIYHKKSASGGIKGSNKLSSLQAYYMARNAIIFARKNLHGVRKVVFINAQFLFRLPYNLLLCINNKSRISYLKGIAHGILS